MPVHAFIDNEWVAPTSGGAIPVIDPSTEDAFSEIAACGAQEIDRAVDAADRAFPAWSRLPSHERAHHLGRIADRLEARLEALAQLETRDNGKPIKEARLDIQDAVGCFRYYAGLIMSADNDSDERPTLPDSRFDCSVRRYPVGVVGQIIPWNYPLLMAAWKVAPALAAGCTTVLKPSELTSMTALELASAAEAADLPRGVLNIVTGTGPECGAPLAAHPKIRKLAFTGSVPTGTSIYAAAAPAIKRLSLELGGKSPFIVFDDADLDAAVEWIMFGIFWNQGEVCSATSRLLVHDRITRELMERLVDAASGIKIGPGSDENVLLGPLVSEGQRRRVEQRVAEGVAAGARLLCGGHPPPDLGRGYFFEPTILDRVETSNPAWTEEIFGPVLCVRPFTDEEEAIALANDTRFGLAAAVMSRDIDRCERVADRLDAGIVWINCSQPTFSEAPWGGTKMSGIGRELGRWGLEQYQELKQITRYRGTEPWGWYARP